MFENVCLDVLCVRPVGRNSEDGGGSPPQAKSESPSSKEGPSMTSENYYPRWLAVAAIYLLEQYM